MGTFLIYIVLYGRANTVPFCTYPPYIPYFSEWLSVYKIPDDTKTFGYVLLFNTLTFIFCVTVIIHRHHPESLIKWLFYHHFRFLYNTQFLNTFIRKIPFIKIFHVALVWALINSWLIMPVIQWDVFFITFFLVSGLILPFDIRDMQYDTVTTFPQIIGIQNTKYLAYLLLFFHHSLLFFLTTRFRHLLFPVCSCWFYIYLFCSAIEG